MEVLARESGEILMPADGARSNRVETASNGD